MTLANEIHNFDNLFKYLEIIEKNVAYMDRMITDLLDVERVSNNKINLKIENINIEEVLIDCKEMFSPATLSKSFLISLDPLLEPIVAQYDYDKILQVLSNLVGNAIKFSLKGGSITLSARKVGQDVVISVSDNGPGIPIEKQSKIFERFSQLKQNDRSGLGLGLFISKWIVEAHNGRIWVTSEVGKGSTFTFTIPLST